VRRDLDEVNFFLPRLLKCILARQDPELVALQPHKTYCLGPDLFVNAKVRDRAASSGLTT